MPNQITSTQIMGSNTFPVPPTLGSVASVNKVSQGVTQAVLSSINQSMQQAFAPAWINSMISGLGVPAPLMPDTSNEVEWITANNSHLKNKELKDCGSVQEFLDCFKHKFPFIGSYEKDALLSIYLDTFMRSLMVNYARIKCEEQKQKCIDSYNNSPNHNRVAEDIMRADFPDFK